jgi:hypothetical protein
MLAAESYLDYCFEGISKIWILGQDAYCMIFVFLMGVLLTPFALLNWITGGSKPKEKKPLLRGRLD